MGDLRSLSPGLRKLLLRRSLASATAEEYVDWAVAELLAEVDTPNLRILAGLAKPLDREDVEFHFTRAVREMGFDLAEPRVFLRAYARDVAQDVAAGIHPPLEAASEFYLIWEAMGYPKSLWTWVELPDELDGEELDSALRREAERLLADPEPPW